MQSVKGNSTASLVMQQTMHVISSMQIIHTSLGTADLLPGFPLLEWRQTACFEGRLGANSRQYVAEDSPDQHP